MCVDFCENLPAPFHKNASVPATLSKIERKGRREEEGGREGEVRVKERDAEIEWKENQSNEGS